MLCVSRWRQFVLRSSFGLSMQRSNWDRELYLPPPLLSTKERKTCGSDGVGTKELDWPALRDFVLCKGWVLLRFGFSLANLSLGLVRHDRPALQDPFHVAGLQPGSPLSLAPVALVAHRRRFF